VVHEVVTEGNAPTRCASPGTLPETSIAGGPQDVDVIVPFPLMRWLIEHADAS
jgi:hypothetical protein